MAKTEPHQDPNWPDRFTTQQIEPFFNRTVTPLIKHGPLNPRCSLCPVNCPPGTTYNEIACNLLQAGLKP